VTQPNLYQIKDLVSPPIRSSSIYGKRLRDEEEEMLKNEEARLLGNEKKNKGENEIDSDDNDFLEDTHGNESGTCKQQ